MIYITDNNLIYILNDPKFINMPDEVIEESTDFKVNMYADE